MYRYVSACAYVPLLPRTVITDERRQKIFFYPFIDLSRNTCTSLWFDHFDDLARYILTSIPFSSMRFFVYVRSKERNVYVVWRRTSSPALSFSFPLPGCRGWNTVIIMASRGTSNNRMTGSLPIPSSNCRNCAVWSTTDTNKLTGNETRVLVILPC